MIYWRLLEDVAFFPTAPPHATASGRRPAPRHTPGGERGRVQGVGRKGGAPGVPAMPVMGLTPAAADPALLGRFAASLRGAAELPRWVTGNN